VTVFGERYRDAIEAGADELAKWSGGHDRWTHETRIKFAEAVLLAATIEIHCPHQWHSSHWLVDHGDVCPACRGSAVLRVLPTTETEK
jgi:hypothetical protein